MNFFGLLAVIIVVIGVVHLAINFMRHRQNMARIRATHDRVAQESDH